MSTDVFRQRLRDELRELLVVIDGLVTSPAEYIEPARGDDPNTGIPLYERALKLRDTFVTQFPQLAHDVPTLQYRSPQYRESLNRDDLLSLRRDVEDIRHRLGGSLPQ